MKLVAVFRPPGLSVSVKGQKLQTGTGIPVVKEYVERPEYEGSYTVTPGSEPQTLQTNGKRMTADVVVGAIPRNYGLISWSGAGIRVS